MTKHYFRISCLIFLIGLIACNSDSSKTKIRIVNLEGKPKPVLTRVPEYNAKLLDGQEFNSQNSNQSSNQSSNNASAEQQATTIAPENKINYTNLPNQQIINTVSTPQDKAKIINDQSDQYNPQKTNMIFAGRSKNIENTEYNLANSKDDVEELESNQNKENSQTNKLENKSIKSKNSSDKNKKNSEKLTAENSAKSYYVQTGSYIAKDIADQELKLMKKFSQGRVEKVQISEDRITYRVLLGPFTNKAQARKMVNKIVNSGHEAILVKNQ
jgi:cell division protein FtsN